MGIPVLILGESGSGKSASLRNFEPEEVSVFNVAAKPIKEFHRYSELKLLERAGKIWDLKRQVPFTLIPAQKEGRKVVERACKYIADFTYVKSGTDGVAELVVEDTKGFKTPEYIIKRKLMLKEFGIRIREV